MNEILQYNKSEINKLNSYIAHIYEQLLEGYKYINNREVLTDNNINTDCISNVEDDTFLPNHIQKFILTKIKYSITYKTIINGKNIRLNFSSIKNEKNEITKEQLNSVFLIIYLLSLYSSKECSKQLNINIFLTPFKKELPKKGQIIGANNVNTGYSNSGCNHTSEIVIYREEEWFKVLIHELFHNFLLDFSTSDIIKHARILREYCGIESNFAIYETYCETWARILNCCIKSFISSSKANYIKKFHKFIELERLFSLKQADLILKQFKKKEEYKETSNVFCYYILTACLINDYLSFLVWCHDNNSNFIKFKDTSTNIDSFTTLIISKLDNDNFNHGIEFVKKLNIKNNKSLRMSII